MLAPGAIDVAAFNAGLFLGFTVFITTWSLVVVFQVLRRLFAS